MPDFPLLIKAKVKVSYITQGQILVRKRNYQEAVQYFSEALKIVPNNFNLNLEIAFCYYQLEDFQKALIYYTKAYSIDNKSEAALTMLKTVRNKLSKKKEVKSNFKSEINSLIGQNNLSEALSKLDIHLRKQKTDIWGHKKYIEILKLQLLEGQSNNPKKNKSSQEDKKRIQILKAKIDSYQEKTISLESEIQMLKRRIIELNNKFKSVTKMSKKDIISLFPTPSPKATKVVIQKRYKFTVPEIEVKSIKWDVDIKTLLITIIFIFFVLLIINIIRLFKNFNSDKETYLEGKISSLPFSILFDVFERNGLTGILEISYHSRIGKIYLNKGRVIQAEREKEKGTSALYQIMNWTDGNFKFYHNNKIDKTNRILLSSKQIYINWTNRIDEK